MWEDTVFITVMHRLKVEAAANTLRPVISGWANETDNLFDWYREE
jgi:peptide/nickel transport system substrate-binding protein